MSINRKINVIEERAVNRDYGFCGTEAIIDHPEHGRLLVCDGFGGLDSLRGGAVRWEHGRVCKLRDSDTFSSLDDDFNEYTTVLSTVVSGYDDSRPVLPWGGHAVARVAKACRLAANAA